MTGVEFFPEFHRRLRFERRKLEGNDRSVFVVGNAEIEFRYQQRAVRARLLGPVYDLDDLLSRDVVDLQALLAMAEKEPVRGPVERDVIERRSLALDLRRVEKLPAVVRNGGSGDRERYRA